MVQRLPLRRRTRQIGVVIAAVVLAFVLSISTLVRLYTDLLWFREVHFTSVFWTVIRSEVVLGVGLGLVFFLFCLANLFIVGRLTPVYRLATDPNDPLNRYRTAAMPYMSWIAAGISAFLGLLFGLSAAPLWQRLVMFSHSVPFHQTDPVFHRDISFFVFRLPFDQFLNGWAFAALIVVTLLVAAAHYATGGIRPQAVTERFTPQVKAHLSVLIGLIALLKAWGYRLGMYSLVFSRRGTTTGASYTDIHAELPALRLLVIISIIGAILFLVNIRFRGWALPIVGAGLWLLTATLAAGVYPLVIQKFVVTPSQLQKETPYIQRNISATREAYGLNALVQPYSDAGTLTPDVAAASQPVLNSIRLWDPTTLETAYQTLQEIRPYYGFQDVNPDRYNINGNLQQVMIATRELNTSALPGGSQTWQNQHLIYTHGYGADVSPANSKTPDGQPQFLVQDIPPTSTVASLQITQPELYYGEGQAGQYTLVDSNQQELDYSTPSGDTFSHYQGAGGIPISGLWNRMLYAWRFKDINILISSLVGKNTKIIYASQIQERLNKAAPFINWDTDPYPVVNNGKLEWIVDGYTVSDMYPYSEQTDLTDRTTRNQFSSIPGTENYIRNSVKATIDAYDGTVKLYEWDATDPIVQAWAKAFPDLFSPASSMDPTTAAHLRYPEDMFSVQTQMYQTYHVTDPRTFFSKGDTWQIPADPNQPTVSTAADHAQEIQPYYVLMQLPGDATASYSLVLPMNPAGKQNMISLIAAKSSPDPGGQKFTELHFPSGSTVQGVGQVHARVNATGVVSDAVTLLGQHGSTVSFGNLLVIPLANTLLYVEPMFVSASTNAVPLMENVIVATANAVGFSTTLDASLQQLVTGQAIQTPGGTTGTVTPATPTGPSLTAQALAQQLQQHLTNAQTDFGKGDFTGYANEMAQVQALLTQAASPAPSPGASPVASPGAAATPSPTPSH